MARPRRFATAACSVEARGDDAPASIEAGQTAIFVDDDDCQRLRPALPPF